MNQKAWDKAMQEAYEETRKMFESSFRAFDDKIQAINDECLEAK